MVFWIFAILSTALIGWWIYNIVTEDFMIETRIGKFFVSLLAVICWGILIVASWWASIGLAVWLTPDYEPGETTTKSLVAVATKDTIEGQSAGSIFASYGYVHGVRTLSYISKDENGAIQVGYVYAQNAYVYEGDDKPRMDTLNWTKENGWFFPFGVVSTAKTYNFHVPVGSVVDGYEIAP